MLRKHAMLGIGDFAVYDCTRPYELHFEAAHAMRD